MEQPSTSDSSRLLPIDDFRAPGRDGVAVRNENSSFVPLKTIPLAVIQIFLSGLLFAESVFILHFGNFCKNQTTPVKDHLLQTSFNSVFEGGCGSVIIYSAALTWILTWVVNVFLTILHRRHRNTGYLQFHSDSAYIADIPLFTMCAGGFVLVIALTLKLDHLVFDGSLVGLEPRFWLFLQILTGTEFLIVFVSLVVYIVVVFKFNRSEPVPDVYNVTNTTSMPLIFDPRSTVEIGPGIGGSNADVELLQSVCERQGDLINYLRHRCDVLCARLNQASTMNL